MQEILVIDPRVIPKSTNFAFLGPICEGPQRLVLPLNIPSKDSDDAVLGLFWYDKSQPNVRSNPNPKYLLAALLSISDRIRLNYNKIR